MTTEQTRRFMADNRICVVVPTYNNGGTVRSVVERVLRLTPQVVVVVDGSTDDTRQQLAGMGVEMVDYAVNRGKGHALFAGFRRAISLGYEYAVTLDSDGQHYPEDIPLLTEALRQWPGALIVGSRSFDDPNMPGGNSFANRFSNFWFTVQTGLRLPDTQTGFRLYPLRRLKGVRFITSRYEAELELLVFAAWGGVPVRPVGVRVYYPPRAERVSHFRPVADFLRITVLNTVLTALAFCYGWPVTGLRKLKQLWKQKGKSVYDGETL